MKLQYADCANEADIADYINRIIKNFGDLSRFRGMMNTPQLTAPFLGVAIFDTARLAARSFIVCEIRRIREICVQGFGY
jgi:hypothetical protein